jgi:hypothetical protein
MDDYEIKLYNEALIRYLRRIADHLSAIRTYIGWVLFILIILALNHFFN